MLRSLRKGRTNIELWTDKSGSVSVDAIETEVELKSDHAVFRTTLKPGSRNQEDDADMVLGNAVSSPMKVSIRDQQVCNKMEAFLRAYQSRIQFVAFEMLYKNKRIEFSGELKLFDECLVIEINMA